MSTNNYDFLNDQRANTPQSEAIPGRESEMTRNLAGGFGFKAGEWTALRRWLCVGSTNNAFYASRKSMTTDNLKFAVALVEQNPQEFANQVVYASNKGLSNSTPLLALVLLSNGSSKDAKDSFLGIFNEVVRTASHLYEFLSYVPNFRGFGTTIQKAVHNWFDSLGASKLSYQMLKYGSRSGWSHRDVLRKFHVRPASTDHDALYGWCVNGSLGDRVTSDEDPLKQIYWVERLKENAGNEAEVLRAIREGNLTHEMVTGNVTGMTNAIRRELLVRMPLTATIRNLGAMTSHGVISFNDTGLTDILESRLCNQDALSRARIHPLVLASAYKVYAGGGTLGKSKLTWNPVDSVLNVLENAVNMSFDALEPTGLRYQFNVDISGSMTWDPYGTSNLSMNPMNIAGILALAGVKAEKHCYVGGFNTSFTKFPMTKRSSFLDSMNGSRSVWPAWIGGGTDASVGYRDAEKNKREVDVFVSITDNMSWAGHNHPVQALASYRNKVNRNTRAVYITVAAPYSDQVTLVDPKDSRSTDLVGFSADSIRYMQMFATGELDPVFTDG